MAPQQVNAYYHPQLNEIVFPAAILQPPFFDATVDSAINFGGIGAVIGHEITHGFDDQGRKFDADGNMNDWWASEDSENFVTRAKVMVDQVRPYGLSQIPPPRFCRPSLTSTAVIKRRYYTRHKCTVLSLSW
jgi:putative endopeptidase